MQTGHLQFIGVQQALLPLRQPDVAAAANYAPIAAPERLVQTKSHVISSRYHHASTALIVAVQYLHSVALKNTRLGGSVSIHVGITVKVIFADIQYGGRIGIQRRGGFQLETGQFQHPYVWLFAIAPEEYLKHRR